MLNKTLENMNYLFAGITSRVAEIKRSGKSVIDMGIGDVTLPLGKTVIEAGVAAVKEMGSAAGFRGYGSSDGYDFLKDAIIKYYAGRVRLSRDEIFISDGAKSDCGAVTDLFCGTALIPEPVYPVYRNSNIIAGNGIEYVRGSRENGFKPLPPPDGKNYAAIYLCSPSNPTGAAYTADELRQWVNYAKKTNAILIFDAAYEAYITEELPHSVFEAEGAEDVAVEINSFSKSAGFTGVRCGYSIIKNPVLKKMWYNRQCSQFNGVSYVVQKMAAAAYSDEGAAEWRTNVKYYLENARLLRQVISDGGHYVVGGVNSPYVWFDCGTDSDSFFEKALCRGLVATPGIGFGDAGKNYIRLTGFSSGENTRKAAEILRKLL